MPKVRNSAILAISYITSLLPVCGTAFCQNAPKAATTPIDVVRQYCNFDFETGRISSANFAKLPALTTWDEEPGWDTVIVVSGFEILSSSQSQNRAVVTVRWAKLGSAEAEDVTEDRKPEVVKYTLKFVDGNWKIDSPVIPPHVSVPALRAFVLSQFKKEPKRQKIWIQKLDALDRNAH